MIRPDSVGPISVVGPTSGRHSGGSEVSGLIWLAKYARIGQLAAQRAINQASPTQQMAGCCCCCYCRGPASTEFTPILPEYAVDMPS